jgi:preprotein translocase subunit SecD
MLNQYPLWKNLTILFVVLIGILYALPNVFGQDPSLSVTANRDAAVDEALERQVDTAIAQAGIQPKRVERSADSLLVRFASPEDQLRGQEAVAGVLTDNRYSHALTLSPDVPGWLTALGGQPMNLGLDLRGGIHVLIDVDMETALKDRLEGYAGDVRTFLRNERLRYTGIGVVDNGVEVKFRDAADRDQAEGLLAEEYRDLNLDTREAGGAFVVRLALSPAAEREIRRAALDQNITTIRNRVNALGVAEPLVQQQGDRRIVV